MLKKLVLISSIILFNFSTNAEDIQNSNKSSPTNNIVSDQELQKIVTEFKEYLSTIPESVREEVIEYRRQIAVLMKQKRELFKTLSQDAQNYLKEEQKYKKKLPIDKKSLIGATETSPAQSPKTNN